MVFTLQRYVFRELLKIFAGATIALTLILSLGSILEPVQEFGVRPEQIVRLLGYFLPITLTFVLPMSALFATAFVYGRLASDNELDACRASGVSLLTVVYPGFCLAVLVAIATLILSFNIMPTFFHRARKAIYADAKQILFRNIQRQGYYSVPGGGYRIYADAANPGADELLGVVVIETNKNHLEKRLVTAASANIYFSPHSRFNELMVIAHDVYQIDVDGEAYSETLPISCEFGSLLADNIKFKKIDEMKMIRNDLLRFYPIAKLARTGYGQLTVETLADDIRSLISGQGERFYRLRNSESLLVFTADECSARDDAQIELGDNVVIFEYDVGSGRQLYKWSCSKAVIELQDEAASRLIMIAHSAKWARDDGSSGIHQRKIFRGLAIPETVTSRLVGNNLIETVESIPTILAEPSPALAKLKFLLTRKINSTLSEIKAEIHSRLVFGIGCISMILVGIGLGIIFKGGHLLTAFGVSSVPAGFLIVCIMTGKNIMKNQRSSFGILLMWGGLLALSVLTAAIYRKLLRT